MLLPGVLGAYSFRPIPRTMGTPLNAKGEAQADSKIRADPRTSSAAVLRSRIDPVLEGKHSLCEKLRFFVEGEVR
jgi:hypothetical protein